MAIAEYQELSSAGTEIQEGIRAGFQEVGSNLGRLVFRRTLHETRITYWLEPGAIVAVESQLDAKTLEQLYEDDILLPERVIEATSNVTGVPLERIIGAGKRQDESMARQLAMYVLRTYGHLSYPRVGSSFSRDHSTVMYAVKKIENLLALESGMPAGKTTVQLKQIESVLDVYLEAINHKERDEEPKNLVDAITITRDGMHSYPTSKIKLLYAKALRIKDADTLVLDHTNRIVSDGLLQTYGGYALDLLGELKT